MAETPSRDLVALQNALDTLNSLHVAIGLVRDHLERLQRQTHKWGWKPVFNRKGEFIGVSRIGSGGEIEFPADSLHCVEIASHCEWLPKYVDSLWKELPAADKALGELPVGLTSKLDALTKSPWLASVRRHCLDKVLAWPGESHHQTSMASEKVHGSILELLEKAKKFEPFETWKEFEQLILGYKADLIAIRDAVVSGTHKQPDEHTRTPWHICDDCLDPLANEIFLFVKRFRILFDVAKSDRLDAEYRAIQDESGYTDDRLTDAQRKRRDDLLTQMSAQKQPPRPLDAELLYRDNKTELAIDWLKFNVSVDYAGDFNRTLLRPLERFTALDFKACQIINGDLGKESTVQIRYAIQRLIDRHYELLRKEFPRHESHPNRDELPEHLRAFEVEILDEYTVVEQEFRKTAEYLQRVSALVRSKLAKAQALQPTALQDPSSAAAELDELVTLDQVAPLTGLSKRTLERHLAEERLPPPDIQGGRGKAHKWFWRTIRAPLATIASRNLPDRFPGSRII